MRENKYLLMYKNLLLIVKLWDMKNAFLEWCKLKTHLFVLIGLFLTIGLHAQQKVITGKVLDEIGEPIVGANVVEKGTTNGTISDVEGDFSLKIDSDASITISFLGYVQQEISVRNKTNITVKLIEDSKSLDEVVVIGYGSARKRDLTGAVAQVKSSDLQNESPSSMQDLLRANIPGLNVGFSAGPKPGGSLQIRGRNSINAGTDPLIVLDGVIYPGDLSDINANDIEQIDVLKDASSAAIYGARSASGVIIITTKMGKSVKPTVKFDVTLGIASMQKRQRVYGPEEFLAWRGDVLESINVNRKPYEYDDPRTLPSDISVEDWLAYDNSKGDPVEVWLGRLSLKPIEMQNYLAGKTVDWEDMVFQNGFRQDYNASISGRSNGLNYFWSMGYTNNEGLSVGNGYKSFRTRLNLDTKITDFLTIGLNSQFVSRDGSAIGADWAQYQKLTPYGSPTNEDGSLKLNPTDDRESKHPLIDAYYTDKKMMTNNLNANIYAKVTLPYNISYQMNFSPRYEWVDDYEHKSSNHPGWADLGGTAYRNTRKDFLWQLDNIVKWQQCFNNAHDIDFTFLFNAEKFQRWTGKMSNEQFSPTDILGFHNIGAGSNPIISSNDEYRTGDALMARIFYSYKQRYMTTVTVRRDGYSAFGQENPRAVFPSAALGWVFSDESFLKHAKWLDYGKLRVSWGVNGNRDIGVYRALAQLTDNKYLYVKPDGTVYEGAYIYVNSLANKSLKWERTTSTNIGIDFTVLHNRLRGSIDVYKMNTKDLLIARTLPNIIGYASVMSNLGEVGNKGLEFTLSSVNIQKKNFIWSSTFNFSLNRNKILHLYGDMEDILDADGNVIGQKEADDKKNKWFIGKAIDEIWEPRVIGVWQSDEAEEAAKYGLSPGDFKVKDVNKDYKYTEDDNEFLGTTTPKFRWTLRNDFQIYKNFDISFMLYSYWGHKGNFNIAKHNSGYQDRYNGFVLPYWTPENPTNNWARLNSSNGSASFNVWRDKSFVRLDNISIGYNFPKKLLKKVKFENLRIFTNIRNVAVWAPDWEFWDPENDGPVPRTYSFGLSLTL